MKFTPLKSLCTFKHGGTPSKANASYWQGDIPWVSPKDMKLSFIIDTTDHVSGLAVENSAASVVLPGSILTVVRSGILAHSFPIAQIGRPLTFNQDIKAVIPFDESVSEDYVYWFLRSCENEVVSRGVKKGATVHSVQSGFIENLMVPLRSEAEQRRIVDLLSRAEGVVRLRREAQKKTSELIPAIFLEMFGDPSTNPKGWKVTTFGDVGILDRGKSRHRPRDAKELYGGEYPFIQTGDVANSGGHITTYSSTYSALGLAQSRLWKVGTLCITIAANIAKTGILEFDACFPDSVVGFIPGSQVKTSFVQAWLGFLQPMLEANAPQAAQKNINLEILRKLPIPLPPLPLQKAFDEHVAAVQSIIFQNATANMMARATFESILSANFDSTRGGA